MRGASIAFKGIGKRFPGVAALRDVTFDVAAGSCHAVCGENGAGKSTLGKLLAGIHSLDAGELLLDGERASFANPRDALRQGVAMVHQELAFCDNLSVAENLCLGALPRKRGFVARRELRARAFQLLDAIGSTIDPDRAIASLSVAEQQVVQIAAAVGAGARVIVFDEPTSSLDDADAERLFSLIGTLRAQGVTLLYVSHRMSEIHRLCDTITVLRDGRHVATLPSADLDETRLVQLMIGRRVDQYYPTHVSAAPGAELLRVEQLSSEPAFRDVSFSVRAGEIVGLAGLVGAGRSEIAEALFGLRAVTSGAVFIDGTRAAIRAPRDAMSLGLGFVPEDRKKQGLILQMRARENATLPTLGAYARAAWLDRRAERRAVDGLFARIRVRAQPDADTATLSGGNQQKIVMAKWLAAHSRILLLDEPTRGVDVGAKAELHAWIDQLATEGCAVVLISSELPELLNLSSRVLVLRAGRVTGELSRSRAKPESVARLMTGVDAAVR